MPETHPSPARLSRRFVPRNSVTVAIRETETPFTYGIVTNLSPSGACIVTASALPTGSHVFLRVSFFRQLELLETEARVVWSRPDSRGESVDRTAPGLLFHGVQFANLATSQRTRLNQLLDSRDFQLAFSPKSGEFENLMNDLSEDLRRLGERFGQETGNAE